MHLVVRVPFEGHEIGDLITDPVKVKAILEGERLHHATHCIKVSEEAPGFEHVRADRPASDE